MRSIKYYLQHSSKIPLGLLNRFGTCLPDKTFLKLKFRLEMGYPLNLRNPRTYNEKLQWLKLYDRRPEYTMMVDKVKAKEYVASVIGEEYIIPTLGVWERAEDVDFDSLPDKFVIKCNHNSGLGMYICRDKSKMDVEAVRKELSKGLKQNYYLHGREWPYKNVPRRIIAEQLLDTSSGEELKDYKFYCFDGVPKVMLISHGRFQGETCFDYFDMDFNLLPFQQGGPNSGLKYEKPKNFELMKELASKLSKGIPHVRIDLYDHHGKVYFGEFTFFDSSGYAPFNPKKWDDIFGDWITPSQDDLSEKVD